MPLIDDAKAEQVEEALGIEREVHARTVRELSKTKSDLTRSFQERDFLRQQLDFVSAIDAAKLKPPRWLRKPDKRGAHRGTVSLLLTDTHFDEVVNPAEIDFINAYNREIAEKRLKRWADKAIMVAREYVQGVEYDGAVLFVGGDIFSGNIHDELKESNEGTLFEAVVYWLEPLCSAIQQLATEFGRLHVGCVVGNHGRSTHKPRAKSRAQDNIEWLMYRWLEREFRNDDRVTFQVADAADLMIQIYGTRYLLTHGDQFRGGSGISGMMAPLMLGQHRKTRRAMAADKPFDWMVMGHLHQYWHGKGIIVGGTLKGFDEYAYVSNFVPEPPTQAFWITTPEFGPSISAPIFVADRKAEGW
jgi:predicted phosphodiesterase